MVNYLFERLFKPPIKLSITPDDKRVFAHLLFENNNDIAKKEMHNKQDIKNLNHSYAKQNKTI